MADRAPRRRPRVRAASLLRRCAVFAVGFAVLAGCGGQSEQDRVAAVARAYDRAFVTGDGTRACALMTPSLRRQIISITGPGPSCAQFVARSPTAVRDSFGLHPFVSEVKINGSRASATVRTNAGMAVLPLAHEDGRWRVDGPARYLSRVWLEADYRILDAAGISASSIASILVKRVDAIIGTRAEARAIGPDEVRLSVAEPTRVAELALASGRGAGRFGLYDWEADAVTPAGRPVADQLERGERSALLISQGSQTDGPGAAGGMTAEHANDVSSDRLMASASAPSAGARGQIPRNWIVVLGKAPSAAGIRGGGDPNARWFVLRDSPVVTRADITHAYASSNQRGEADINLGFTARGARAFQRLTAAIARRGATLSTGQLAVNQHIAVLLEGRVVSVVHVDFRVYPHGIPTANGVSIVGGFSAATAQQLAGEIIAPPMPAALQLIHSSTFTRKGS
jgi:hypothetical protein